MPESDYRQTLQAGILRGGTREEKFQVNEKGELFAAQGLPPYTEMARKGEGFSVIATVAVAALVVRPSTVAMITLFNNEQAGGKAYIIDRLFSHCLVAGGEAGNSGIWACVHPSGMTNPGVDIAASAVNITGPTGKIYGGRAVVGIEETVVDNGWYPWGPSVQQPPTALPGTLLEAKVEGRLIIPPQGAISIQVVASVIDETFTSGLSWHEEAIDLQ